MGLHDELGQALNVTKLRIRLIEKGLQIESIRRGGVYLSPRLRGESPEKRKGSSDPLSRREKEILKWVAEGKSNKEIAEVLFISARTVESHRAHIMSKLEINTTAGLRRYRRPFRPGIATSFLMKTTK